MRALRFEERRVLTLNLSDQPVVVVWRGSTRMAAAGIFFKNFRTVRI